MSGADEVTIIVPTRGDQEQVQRCVDAIAASAAGGVTSIASIMVVDNGPASTVQDLGPVEGVGRVPVQVRVLHEPVPGASSARNLGLAAATTEVVVFVDDDVVVGAGWLDALLVPLAGASPAATDVVGVVGPIVLECPGPRPRWLTANLEVWFSALDHGRKTRPLGAGEYGWSANLAVRRSAALDIGGFDTRLGPGTAASFNDDVDFVDRLRSNGAVIVYAGDATVRHLLDVERLRLRWLRRRGYRQGRAFVALDRIRGLEPRRRQPIHAARALAGAIFAELPRLVRTVRNPEQRRSVFADQLVQRALRVGLAAGRWSSSPDPHST